MTIGKTRRYKLQLEAWERGVIICGFLITPTVWASGGSTLDFSLYMFAFFGVLAFIFTKVVKYYSKNIVNKILMKIIEVSPISLLISPTFFIDDGNSILLPSAVVLVIAVVSKNVPSLYSLLISVSVTFIFLYFLKVSKIQNLQDNSTNQKNE